MPPTSGLTKEDIKQGWKREADKIYKEPNKYGADEVWIYRYPNWDEDRFYFKEGILIKEEEVLHGSF